jgi:hypothetical protein
MAINLLLIGRILGLLPFSGVMFIVLFSKFMSIHFSLCASPILIPVSLSICSIVLSFLPHDAVSWSISVSVGMKGIFSSWVYFGLSHFSPLYLM